MAIIEQHRSELPGSSFRCGFSPLLHPLSPNYKVRDMYIEYQKYPDLEMKKSRSQNLVHPNSPVTNFDSLHAITEDVNFTERRMAA